MVTVVLSGPVGNFALQQDSCQCLVLDAQPSFGNMGYRRFSMVTLVLSGPVGNVDLFIPVAKMSIVVDKTCRKGVSLRAATNL